jgi:hypothetical protein
MYLKILRAIISTANRGLDILRVLGRMHTLLFQSQHLLAHLRWDQTTVSPRNQSFPGSVHLALLVARCQAQIQKEQDG